MASFDPVTPHPMLGALVQTQYLLFGAALVIGFTMIEAQLGAHAPQAATAAAPKPAPAKDQKTVAMHEQGPSAHGAQWDASPEQVRTSVHRAVQGPAPLIVN